MFAALYEQTGAAKNVLKKEIDNSKQEWGKVRAKIHCSMVNSGNFKQRIFLPILSVSMLLAKIEPLFAQTANNIAASAAKLERIWSGGTVTEAVASAPDGLIYFADVTPSAQSDNRTVGHIYRYNPQTGETELFRSPSGQTNGAIFDGRGDFITAAAADGGGRWIAHTEMNTGLTTIVADSFRGRLLNSPNDLVVDSKGRIYFSDPRYYGLEPIEQPVQGVYRIDLDGSVHLIIADLVPNGVAISPDGRTLYVADHNVGTMNSQHMPKDLPRPIRHRLLAYDLAKDGSLSEQTTLVDFGEQTGIDGMTVSESGNIYAAVRDTSRFGIRVYSPLGKEIGYIPTPKPPQNLAFGRDDDATTLYISAGGNLYRVRTTERGYHLPAR